MDLETDVVVVGSGSSRNSSRKRSSRPRTRRICALRN